MGNPNFSTPPRRSWFRAWWWVILIFAALAVAAIVNYGSMLQSSSTSSTTRRLVPAAAASPSTTSTALAPATTITPEAVADDRFVSVLERYPKPLGSWVAASPRLAVTDGRAVCSTLTTGTVDAAWQQVIRDGVADGYHPSFGLNRDGVPRVDYWHNDPTSIDETFLVGSAAGLCPQYTQRVESWLEYSAPS